ncbi:Uncharacterised protein [Vibrio cholerae]|nr:Uncharacterised protein [Vibrio cholerae]
MYDFIVGASDLRDNSPHSNIKWGKLLVCRWRILTEQA